MKQTCTSFYPAAIVHTHTCLKSSSFWEMTPCYWMIGLEMSGTDYPVTRRHIPEDRSPKYRKAVKTSKLARLST
jgi:hypothetical protein